VEVGHEMFMGPEMFFRPEIIDAKWNQSLVRLLEETILLSPIDCRRKLYQNIILSGGSTSVEGLHKRLEKELRAVVDERLSKTHATSDKKPQPIEINIQSSPYKNFAVWNGGSMLAIHVRLRSPRTTFPTTTTRGPSTSSEGPPSPATTPSSPSVACNQP
jgi:actin-related protein 3